MSQLTIILRGKKDNINFKSSGNIWLKQMDAVQYNKE